MQDDMIGRLWDDHQLRLSQEAARAERACGSTLGKPAPTHAASPAGGQLLAIVAAAAFSVLTLGGTTYA